MMKQLIFIFCLITFPLFSNSVQKTYTALNSTKESDITEQIQWLKKNETGNMKNAYIAALTMKQASFQWTPWSKWNLFSTGRDLLEKEIQKNKGDVEMRFLRLMVQENAPGIVGYSNKIKEDSKLIIENFATLPKELKTIIKSYAAQSTALVSLKNK